jgi:hypothetical protein
MTRESVIASAHRHVRAISGSSGMKRVSELLAASRRPTRTSPCPAHPVDGVVGFQVVGDHFVAARLFVQAVDVAGSPVRDRVVAAPP